MIKSQISALANHFGCDQSELSEYRYKSTRFTKSVYSLSDGLFCATKNANKLPQPINKSDNKVEWNEIQDAFVNQYGWRIFKAANY